MTSSVSSSVYGQSVTFTATVAAVAPGTGTSTGTVEFYNNGTDMGPGTSQGSGVWTLSTAALAVGLYPDITADYSGDANFLGSDSAAFSQTVSQASSTTTLTSSPNPSVSASR